MQFRHLAATACLAVVCFQAIAAPPLTLRYSIADLSDGTYRYSFVLTLDDPSGTWTKGDGYGWIIFADRSISKSPFEDWASDPGSLSGGPWRAITNTSGYNNGPTLGNGRSLWAPTFKGESVVWTGVTSARLSPSELRWSCLIVNYINPIGKPRGPIASLEPSVYRCPADFDNDGFVNGDDFDRFIVLFTNGATGADIDRDGFVTGDDFDQFVRTFEAGC